MYEDSSRAIELDKNYFKSFLRNGEACVELGKIQKCNNIDLIDKGIKQLQKAYAICWAMSPSDPKYDHKSIFEKEISKQILRAKKIKWFKEKELMLLERQTILNNLR